MKKLFSLFLTIAALTFGTSAFAQSGGGGNYQGPGVLNIGLTSGFGDYLGVQADYEIAQLGQDFTVGASVAFQSWNDGKNDNGDTSFAVGARFRWYADRVLNISHPKWDVFANGDIGFNINGPNGLWWGIGIGGKFHISEAFGLQAIIGSGAQLGVTFQL
ncbi:hypothetical protein KMW28_17050 [Flammeovirga yaeyamensis]|uniref:Outer membrane protein beta-barrel domain-containing protein n=1 Tax=Flammeovirga yaeyamensis TaxID=367791 RepID=A0AAX1N283_9BACT|nr:MULTISPECIES: hypothetical protein [Flammeovirga]ANQ51219.1 hypothetical protein MY04_3875 [Flammeovirga sp. MY04]MBB3698274.1 hypothetical protein [Flammeovirga yaeyamensis]NMF34371.1 hypothetical protein [Flammeovirga yaeyamensis]QWG01352.1 hypothetical protein KMW28_17050 [Flammeovirga yaeyamensis]